MSLLQPPSTSKGVLIALGIVASVIIIVYSGALLTMALGVTVIVVLIYLLWVVGVRIHRLFIGYSPWRRST